VGKILCATRGGEGSHLTQDAAIAMSKEKGAELIFLFVADSSFLNNMAAPMVVDLDVRLEDLGQFELARAKQRALSQGIKAQTVVRHGKLRSELIATAQEMEVTVIVLGRPTGKSAVFQEDTLRTFADEIEEETGVEVVCL
jgi:nucleotide-binding universal stress UspA family protein